MFRSPDSPLDLGYQTCQGLPAHLAIAGTALPCPCHWVLTMIGSFQCDRCHGCFCAQWRGCCGRREERRHAAGHERPLPARGVKRERPPSACLRLGPVCAEVGLKVGCKSFTNSVTYRKQTCTGSYPQQTPTAPSVSEEEEREQKTSPITCQLRGFELTSCGGETLAGRHSPRRKAFLITSEARASLPLSRRTSPRR
eukprot:2907184-Rhodomonas_salina.2